MSRFHTSIGTRGLRPERQVARRCLLTPPSWSARRLVIGTTRSYPWTNIFRCVTARKAAPRSHCLEGEPEQHVFDAVPCRSKRPDGVALSVTCNVICLEHKHHIARQNSRHAHLGGGVVASGHGFARGSRIGKGNQFSRRVKVQFSRRFKAGAPKAR